MIRQLAILAIAAFCLAVSTRAAGVPETRDIEAERSAISNFLLHIYEGSVLKPEVLQRLESRTIDEVYSENAYPKWVEAIKKLEARLRTGMLPHGEIFSVYHPYQLDEAVLIFNVFYFAPTIWEFLWAVFRYQDRVNINQFNYALSVALIHRTDTKWLPMAQPYEFYPEYFFNSDVMKRIYDVHIGHCDSVGGNFSIEANYTNWYTSNPFDNDIGLTYFMEDIGLNTWYYYFNQRYPFWMSSEEYPEIDFAHRGELYYYIHKMFLNRYNMERLSNGMGFVDFADWSHPVFEPYLPYMSYKNGFHFPTRPAYTSIPVWKQKYVNKLYQFESRVAGAADSGYVMLANGTFVSIYTPEGFESFGNLVQGNNDSYNSRYYGSVDFYGRYVLGFSPEPHNWYQILPSALEHFSTSLRDPAFYRLYGKINDYFFSYKKHLGFYTPAELDFKPVTINTVTIPEELFTYFERVPTTIKSYWWTPKPKPLATVTVFQKRLNYHPYTYNFDITSTEHVNVSIRVFLGPKYDMHGKHISDNYKNFFQLDYFVKELTAGHNVFERRSGEAAWLAPDYTSSEFHYITEDAEKLVFDTKRFGFPARMNLPKGTAEGMPFQFFFYISEYVEGPHSSQSPVYSYPLDNKPFGFPLDRPIYDFYRSNMYFLDRSIFHKTKYQPNLTTQ